MKTTLRCPRCSSAPHPGKCEDPHFCVGCGKQVHPGPCEEEPGSIIRIGRRRYTSCHYCKVQGKRLTKDHIIPKARGGTGKVWNFVPACVRCNSAKGDRLPTCQCWACRTAVEMHWEYVMGFHPSIRDPLLAKVAGLYD